MRSSVLLSVAAAACAVSGAGCDELEPVVEQGVAIERPVDAWAGDWTFDVCAAAPHWQFHDGMSSEWRRLEHDIVVTSAEATGPGSLAEALALAEDGDVIGFEPGLPVLEITPTSTLRVERSITIDGTEIRRLELNGALADPVLSVAPGLQTTVAGLFFADGGVAIEVEATSDPAATASLDLVGCRFEDHGGNDPAVRVLGGTQVRLVDTAFRRNTTTSDRVAGLYVRGGRVEVERCEFESNSGGAAGAIHTEGASVEVIESRFRADDGREAGAIRVDTRGVDAGGPTVQLERVDVSQATSGERGVVDLVGDPDQSADIEHVWLHANQGRDGGVRLAGFGTTTVRNSTFAESSGVRGVGIRHEGAGDLTVVNTTFSNNVATGFGGGIAHAGGGRMAIESSLFAELHADQGGGIWLGDGVEAYVRNTILADNTAAVPEARHLAGTRPVDAGGNIEFATVDPEVGRAFVDARFVDPGLAELWWSPGGLMRAIGPESPAVDAANGESPPFDARSAPRDGIPDIGPWEVSGSCF